jgi:GNAT superfamily N-acetyltransferase
MAPAWQGGGKAGPPDESAGPMAGQVAHGGRAWRAVAYHENEVAGQAWSFLDGDLAGVFDMDAWPRFRRRGIRTGLLRAVCGAARNAGAETAVLNATPQGKLLYSACGFTQIGEGITYWLHLKPGGDQL